MTNKLTELEFAEKMRELTIERLLVLIPKKNDMGLICAGNRALEIKHRWLNECIRDNAALYRASTMVLQKHGVLNETKANNETMELFGRIVG